MGNKSMIRNKEMNFFNPMALREKYGVKAHSGTNSSFWMDDNYGRKSSIFDSWGEEEEVKKPSVDVIALAAYRRSISNFVNIVTGRNDINVRFASGDSYTDGKNVTISSNIKEKSFDATVGLALHEGSHILLSDFEFLKKLEYSINNEVYLKAEKKGYKKREVVTHLKNLLNYVEDRRIDNYIFTTSPGYKGYYHSMYKTYFHSNIIDKGLKSDEYTSNDWESFMFRIINMTNANRRLDAIDGLTEIYNLLFVKNHPSTINSTEDAFKIAIKVYEIILNKLNDGVEETNEFGEVSTKPASGSSDDNDEKNSEGGSGGSGEGESKELSDEEFEGLKKSVEGGEVGRGHGSGSDIVLSEAQKKQLEKAFDKQKDFVEGNPKKTKLAKKYANEIKSVEESGMTLEEVGGKELGEINWRTDKMGSGKTHCIVIERITDSLLENNLCQVLRKSCYGSDGGSRLVVEGIRLGTMLGKKLKVRNESRDTKWTRKDSGRIDKRLIAELGFGNERVFSTTFTDSYADAHLHISIDASGSMSGDKWDNTIKSSVAICKAASMIEGLTVDVSFRYTSWGNNRGEEKPAILIAYDSRKNKMSHIKKYWKYLRVCGTTPEGLCYQAIMDKISIGSREKDSFFLNFSDGMPMFSNGDIRYYHDEALNHTKKMVKEIRGKGVKVLSYYIGGEYERESNMGDFKKMYGKDAKFIDVNSVSALAKTMNKKFLEKN
jgi:hypothetical protein